MTTGYNDDKVRFEYQLGGDHTILSWIPRAGRSKEEMLDQVALALVHSDYAFLIVGDREGNELGAIRKASVTSVLIDYWPEELTP